MTGAWRVVARLQELQLVAKSEAAESALDAMIDRQIDRIASNQSDVDDPVELQRAVAAANRRKRYRVRLARLYFADSPLDKRGNLTAPQENSCAARQALAAIFAQASLQDSALLQSVARGDAPCAPGVTATAARKRVSRLRARFSHLNFHAA